MCHRTYTAANYRKNTAEYKRRKTERRSGIQRWLRTKKGSLSCGRCGESHIACITFHHRNPDKKEMDIGLVTRNGWGLDRIKREIAKCDVLCENCHRKLHYELRNGPIA